MRIDKSKMTPEDAAQFERMAKAYGWVEDETVPGGGTGDGGSVEKVFGARILRQADRPQGRPIRI